MYKHLYERDLIPLKDLRLITAYENITNIPFLLDSDCLSPENIIERD